MGLNKAQIPPLFFFLIQWFRSQGVSGKADICLSAVVGFTGGETLSQWLPRLIIPVSQLKKKKIKTLELFKNQTYRFGTRVSKYFWHFLPSAKTGQRTFLAFGQGYKSRKTPCSRHSTPFLSFIFIIPHCLIQGFYFCDKTSRPKSKMGGKIYTSVLLFIIKGS